MTDLPEPAGPTPPASEGIWCAEIELSDLTTGLSGPGPHRGEPVVRVLVRLHGEPLGYLPVTAAAGLPAADEIARQAVRTFGDGLRAHLAAEGSTLPTEAGDAPGAVPAATDACPNEVTSGDETVSVVVCTRNRADELAACMTHLAGLTYPHLEILVVDNAPTDDATELLVRRIASDDARFRYVREPRPGLSCARNRGLAAATGRYLAYTDDDVAVDPRWVHSLIRGFRATKSAACVTGLVCTASVSGAAEAYFDARAASWSSRMQPQIFDLGAHALDDALYPYSPGIFGTGANFAFDRQFLLDLGGFDEALGAGTRTRGGEDLDIFVRVLNAGRAIVYVPSAIVWHHHRADVAGLLKQLYGYGTGLSAFVAKCLVQKETRGPLLRRIPLGVRRMFKIRATTEARLEQRYPAPRGALAREVAGFAAGPWLYWRARNQVRLSRARASALPSG